MNVTADGFGHAVDGSADLIVDHSTFSCDVAGGVGLFGLALFEGHCSEHDGADVVADALEDAG